MNSHKKKFYLLPAQVAWKRADKLDRDCSSYQCGQRQYSRFQGMLKNIFGGKKNLQQFLATEKFTHRMLPPVTPWADMKPLDKRYANKKSKEAKVKGKRRYYESLAKDLMDPANAPKRATRRFETILEAMDRARAGHSFFLPIPRGDHRGIVAWWSRRQGQEQGGMAVHPLQLVDCWLGGAESKAAKTPEPAARSR